MIVISAKDITKEYGTDVILRDVSFHVDQGDRIGMIGANGAGKTTLLKILTGELGADAGSFFIAENTTIGYLKQQEEISSEMTVMEEVTSIFASLEEKEAEMERLSKMISELTGSPDQEELLYRYDSITREFEAAGGYKYRSEIRGILTSMAFGEEYYDKPVAMLSGGEKTRLALACLLLKKPDILFLDEPTNHLDIGTLRWLEQYLAGYRGTIILVSHDRYFLDQTVNRIFEVENHRLTAYDGSYKTYAKARQSRREEMLRAAEKQQKEIDKQQEIIRRFKGRGTEKLAKRAASRERMLERMEPVKVPEGPHGRMKIRFKERFRSGSDVLHIEELAKSFGYGANKKELFHGVDLDIKRGDRICIVGPNGIGKTTLMKMMMGDIGHDSGYIKKGHNVEFGYYDQEQQLLNDSGTVLEELHGTYRLYSETELRSILGRFLFTGDMVFLRVGDLSGGEKARLSLLKLMLSGANTLLLDEPTNHLDIESKEIFEDALIEFPGTALIVSHDRYLLSKVPTKIVELGREGAEVYLGKYDYYMEKKQEIASGRQYLRGMSENRPAGESQKDGPDADAAAGDDAENRRLDPAEERRLKKQKEAEERRKTRENQRLEQEIQAAEARIADIEAEMCREEVATDHDRLKKLSDELASLKDDLDGKYEKWLQ